MRKTEGRAAVGLWASLTLLGLAACGPSVTVEQQIIGTIREMEERIEKGQSRRFMEFVAEDFSGQPGARTRREVQALVVFQLKRYQRLRAQLLPIHVTPQGEDLATARFRALVTGGPNWLPESGQLYEFRTGWSRREGDWRLVSATWEPIPLEEAL